MDTLKKFFPLSFKYSNSSANLVIGIILYLVIGIVSGALAGLATVVTVLIPFVGLIIAWVLGLLVSLLSLYVIAGITIEVLLFCKVLKD